MTLPLGFSLIYTDPDGRVRAVSFEDAPALPVEELARRVLVPAMMQLRQVVAEGEAMTNKDEHIADAISYACRTLYADERRRWGDNGQSATLATWLDLWREMQPDILNTIDTYDITRAPARVE
jgi:hypothetical protein